MAEDPRFELEATRLREFIAAAGPLTEEDYHLDAPPPMLWASIATEMGHPATTPNPLERGRSSRSRMWMPAAAAVLVGVVLAGGWSVSRVGKGDVVATAVLANEGLSPLGVKSTGTAKVVHRGKATVLRLSLRQLPQQPSSYTEVWLIDTKVKGMISLGPFHGDGDYTIPRGVDPALFPVVDVSIEPTDGNPTHSGVSIVRGVEKSA
jgi:anti-sigma-K factor RskA